MKLRGINQALVHVRQLLPGRRVFDYFHEQSFMVKTSLGLFGGTALVGSAVIWTAAHPTPVAIKSTAAMTAPVKQTDTTPPAISVQAQTPSPSSSSNVTKISHSSTSQNGNTSNTTEVTVNGQSVAIPSNGSVHQTISSDDGTNQVDVTVDNNSQNGNISYTTVQTNSSHSGSTSTFTNQSGSSD